MPTAIIKTRRGTAIITIAILLVFIFVLLDIRVGRLLVRLAESDITDAITVAMNTAVKDILSEKKGSPIRLLYDEKGRIAGEETDTVLINELQTDIVNRLYDYIPDTEKAVIAVPLGNVLGSRLLSGLGLIVPVKILSVTNIEPALYDEFDSVGINQTRHRISLRVEIGLSVLVPGYEGETTVSADYPIAETIIAGDVPETIINY